MRLSARRDGRASFSLAAAVAFAVWAVCMMSGCGDTVVSNEASAPAPAPAYTLRVNAGKGGTVRSDPSKAFYGAGDKVTITAVPDSGYSFAGWAGGQFAAAYAATATVTVNSSMSIKANFRLLRGVAPPVDYGALVDVRDGQTYNTIEIGGRTWMARNLNYQAPDSSWCFGGKADSCGKYGRLYDWNTAMAVCPNGWRLPTRYDWNDMVIAIGGAGTRDSGGDSGVKLRAESGWYGNVEGTDDYGFSALPGGYRGYDGGFHSAGCFGRWWTATETGGDLACLLYMFCGGDGVYEDYHAKGYGYSVRCVLGD